MEVFYAVMIRIVATDSLHLVLFTNLPTLFVLWLLDLML